MVWYGSCSFIEKCGHQVSLFFSVSPRYLTVDFQSMRKLFNSRGSCVE